MSLLLNDASMCLCVSSVRGPRASACLDTLHQGSSVAISCLQEAAGAFAFLRDVAGLRVEQPRPVDISPEAAGDV